MTAIPSYLRPYVVAAFALAQAQPGRTVWVYDQNVSHTPPNEGEQYPYVSVTHNKHGKTSVRLWADESVSPKCRWLNVRNAK